MTKPAVPATTATTAAAAAAPAPAGFFARFAASATDAPSSAFPRIAQPTDKTDPVAFAAQVRAAVAAATAEVSAKRPELRGADLTDAALSRCAERFNAHGFRPFGGFVDPAKRYPANSPRRSEPFWYRENLRRLVAECSAE